MKLYRCVPPGDVREFVPPQSTRRAPSNIPYFVDNVWEWLRPLDMPSRRHAVYASPSPDLARRGASGSGRDASTWPVLEVVLPNDAHAVQCRDKDSREHLDVKNISTCVFQRLNSAWKDSSLEDKLDAGKLFIPVLSADETGTVLETAGLVDEIRKVSTYWKDVTRLVQASNLHGDGEIFFEAPSGYRLLAI